MTLIEQVSGSQGFLASTLTWNLSGTLAIPMVYLAGSGARPGIGENLGGGGGGKRSRVQTSDQRINTLWG